MSWPITTEQRARVARMVRQLNTQSSRPLAGGTLNRDLYALVLELKSPTRRVTMDDIVYQPLATLLEVMGDSVLDADAYEAGLGTPPPPVGGEPDNYFTYVNTGLQNNLVNDNHGITELHLNTDTDCDMNFQTHDDLELVDAPEWTGSNSTACYISNCPSLVTVNLPKADLELIGFGGVTCTSCSALTTVDLSQAVFGPNAVLDLSGCALSEATVNAILVRAATFLPTVVVGNINLSGGTSAAPSGAGAAASSALSSAGWTIATN